MDKFLETVEKIWANSFVQAFVYLIIGLIAAILASFIVKKFCKLLKLDKWGGNNDQSTTAIKFIGKLTFLIVFLLFLPSALHALGLTSVSDPITDFAAVFISYLPNVIAALILVFIGIFLGQLLSQLITTLLSKTKIDNLGKKQTDADTEAKEGVKISAILGKLVNAIVVLIAVVQALIVLDIEVISAPALEVIGSFFGAIPEIVLAIILVAVGLLVASVVCGVLENLLIGVRFDELVRKIAPSMNVKFSATKIVTGVVRVLIIFFIIAESIEVLGFTLLTNVFTAVIAYMPMIIKALIIAALAYFAASLTSSFVSKSFSGAKLLVPILRSLIYVVAGFMILSQLDFAATIVNYAFVISLCALAIAFAIAFGIGGRDFAKRTLDRVKLGGADSGSEQGDKPEEQGSSKGSDNS